MSVSIYGSGQTILQAVQGTLLGSVSTTSTSFVATGLSASITPQSTTSKILIIVSGNSQISTNSVGAEFGLYRGGTLIQTITSSYTSGGGNSIGGLSMTWLDSPSTTSSTTYSLYYCVSGSATASFMGSVGGNDTLKYGTITLLEVSGS